MRCSRCRKDFWRKALNRGHENYAKEIIKQDPENQASSLNIVAITAKPPPDFPNQRLIHLLCLRDHTLKWIDVGGLI